MKKTLILLVLIMGTVFLVGCTQDNEKTELTKIFEENDCFWDLNDKTISLENINGTWVASKDNCLGRCIYNPSTKEFYMDPNEMCLGEIEPV